MKLEIAKRLHDALPHISTTSPWAPGHREATAKTMAASHTILCGEVQLP